MHERCAVIPCQTRCIKCRTISITTIHNTAVCRERDEAPARYRSLQAVHTTQQGALPLAVVAGHSAKLRADDPAPLAITGPALGLDHAEACSCSNAVPDGNGRAAQKTERRDARRQVVEHVVERAAASQNADSAPYDNPTLRRAYWLGETSAHPARRARPNQNNAPKIASLPFSSTDSMVAARNAPTCPARIATDNAR